MANRHRLTEIRCALFEIENPPSLKVKTPGPIARNKVKALFNAGELAVIAYLVDHGDANITDVPSSIAARELVRLKLVSSTRRMAHSPVSGNFLTKRIELTTDGQTIANFIYPRL